MAALFLVSAALQYNDDTGVAWAALYFVGGCFVSGLHEPAESTPLALFGFVRVGLPALLPTAVVTLVPEERVWRRSVEATLKIRKATSSVSRRCFSLFTFAWLRWNKNWVRIPPYHSFQEK